MKRAVVCGAGGFIGSHLVKRLKADDYWVRGVDLKYPVYSPTEADEFYILDLRRKTAAYAATDGCIDELYQLAADMGGMGFISSSECEIMRNSALININMIDAAAEFRVGRYLFSSSACVYRDMSPTEPELTEADAYPANPHNEYGWEKLYAERMAQAYSRRHGFPVRIARFQNCYGAEGTFDGGREKAPAALCRKVAEAVDGGAIDIWGDGSAMRAYTHVDDMVDGIVRLMQSDLEGGVNIGRKEYVSVDQLAETVIKVSGKILTVNHIDGPVGVKARNFTNDRIESIGWKSKIPLEAGIALTYPWIDSQIKRKELTLAPL